MSSITTEEIIRCFGFKEYVENILIDNCSDCLTATQIKYITDTIVTRHLVDMTHLVHSINELVDYRASRVKEELC